jgi:hypothetical protein
MLMRKASWILSSALLGITGAFGLMNGIDQLGDGGGALQRSVTFGVLLYGVLGLAGSVGLIRRRPWSVTLAAAWAATVTYVATVASFAFHDPRIEQQGTLSGVIGAFFGAALIGAFVIWSARAAARGPLAPPAPSANAN